MHSKQKGNIGQIATAFCFAKHGWSIFTEEGDLSKIDLIAEKNGNLLRIQCKAVMPVHGSLTLTLIKRGPNYFFKYRKEMFDYFSVFDLLNENLSLIDSSVLLTHKKSFSLRISKTKNKQQSGINQSEEFLASNVLARLA